MIALLMSLGLAKRAAQILGYVGVPLLLILGAGLALDSWGDSRYRAGRADEQAVWKAASDKLIQQAATSGDAATRKEAARLLDHAAQVEHEKEKIDAAIENGTSPVDALFPVTAGNGL